MRSLTFFFHILIFSAMNYLFKPPLWMAILGMMLYTGCDKTTTEPQQPPIHTVSGTVLEYGTKKPIPNASIYVMKYFGTLLGPEGFSLLDSAKTDANGKYTFKTTDADFINVRKQGYFKLSSAEYAPIPIDILSSRPTAVTKDIVIDPIGWLKIRVKNVKPQADNDKIVFSDYACTPNSFLGKTVDKFSICPLRGNRKNDFIYFVDKLGISILHEESIYIKGLDTTYYSINY
jgi:hypothetical protein